MSWQVYQLTGHAFDLGLIGLAQFAPFLLLFLVAGAAADRWPRARILGVCGGVQTLCALLLSVLTWTHTASFPRLLTLLVLLGVARAFQSPASQAILPLLVPPGSFARAVAWTTLGTQGARIGGPALAGGLLLLGQTYVYGAAMGCLALSTVFTWLLRAKTQVVSRERPSLASCSPGRALSGRVRCSSARSRSISSRCCLAAPPFCRSMPSISCTSARWGLAVCARGICWGPWCAHSL